MKNDRALRIPLAAALLAAALFTWSNITATSGHWEQAFSPDGGKTWETNWITDFRR